MKQGICTSPNCELAKSKTVQNCDEENGAAFQCRSCLSDLQTYNESKNPFAFISDFFKNINPNVYKYGGIVLGVVVLIIFLINIIPLIIGGGRSSSDNNTPITPPPTKTEVDSVSRKIQSKGWQVNDVQIDGIPNGDKSRCISLVADLAYKLSELKKLPTNAPERKSIIEICPLKLGDVTIHKPDGSHLLVPFATYADTLTKGAYPFKCSIVSNTDSSGYQNYSIGKLEIIQTP